MDGLSRLVLVVGSIISFRNGLIAMNMVVQIALAPSVILFAESLLKIW